MTTLRDEITRLAHENPDGIREHLVPLLRTAAKTDYIMQEIVELIQSVQGYYRGDGSAFRPANWRSVHQNIKAIQSEWPGNEAALTRKLGKRITLQIKTYVDVIQKLLPGIQKAQKEVAALKSRVPKIDSRILSKIKSKMY